MSKEQSPWKTEDLNVELPPSLGSVVRPFVEKIRRRVLQVLSSMMKPREETLDQEATRLMRKR